MKSYSGPGKKSKAHSKSSELSDEQLLEKFAIRKCSVKITPLKSEECDLSEISSSSPKAEERETTKNKPKKFNSKYKEKSKKNHVEFEVIENGDQNLHYVTSTDHPELSDRNQEIFPLPLKKRGRKASDLSQHLNSRFSEDFILENEEQAERSSSTEADLAKRKRTRSSSTSSRETHNLDSESSEVQLTDHEAANESRITSRSKRRNNLIGSSSNSNRKSKNLVSGSYKATLRQVKKIDQKQTRGKEINKSSTDLKTQKENLELEFSKEVSLCHEKAEESIIAETDMLKRSRTRSSSNSSRETLKLVSECSEATLVDHEQEEKVNQNQIRKNKKSRTSTDSKKEEQNLNSECAEEMLSSHDPIEESYLTETHLSRKNRTRSSSDSKREMQNLSSDCSEEMFSRHKPTEENNLAKTDLSKKNRIKSSLNSKRKIQNLDSEISKKGVVYHEQTDKSIQGNTQKRSKKESRSDSNSNEKIQNLDPERSEAMLSSHVQSEENNFTEVDLSIKIGSTSDSKIEAQNLSSDVSEEMLSSHEQTEKSNLTEPDLLRESKTRSSSNSSRIINNNDSQFSKEILVDHEQAEESNREEIQKRGKKKIKSFSNSNKKTQNLDTECSEAVLSSHEQGKISPIKTSLSRKNRTQKSSNTSTGSHNFDSECSEKMQAESKQTKTVSKTGTRSSRREKSTRTFSKSNRKNESLDSESTESIPINLGQVEESCLTKTDLSQKNSIRSSSNSSCGSHNFNSECSETKFSICALGEESNLAENDLSRKDETGNSSNSSKETQNLDSVCSQEMLDDHEPSKVFQEVKKRKNSRSFNSNKVTRDCLEPPHISHEQAEKINWRQTRNRNRNQIFESSRENQNLDSDCSEITPFSQEKVDQINQKQTRNRKNIRSPSESSREVQNSDSEYSEIPPFNHEKAETINRERNRSSSDSSREIMNLDSTCSETAPFSLKKAEQIDQRQTRSRKKNRSPSESSIEVQNLGSDCSEITPFSHEKIDQIDQRQTRNKKNNRSPSESSREVQNSDSEYSEIPPFSHEKEETSNRERNRSSSDSSREILNLNSKCSETTPFSLKKAEQIDQRQTRSKKKNRNPSESSIEIQNLDSECSETAAFSYEKAVTRSRKGNSSSDSNGEILNLDSECSETAALSYEKAETRSRKRNRSPSDSSRKIQHFNSKSAEIVFANLEQGIESEVAETDVVKYRNRSPSISDRGDENSISECSEAILASNQQKTEICLRSTKVRRSNRTRICSNSSDETQSLNSEHLEAGIPSSEREEITSLTEINISENKSRSSSDCSREIQNLDSKSSDEHATHTDLQQVVLMSHHGMLAAKRTRNSSDPSNCFLQIQNSHFEDYNNELHSQTHKEKNQFNLTQSQKYEKKNYVLPTLRRTRNSSNLCINKSSSSEIPEKISDHYQTPKLNFMHQSTDCNNKRSQDHEQSQDVYLDSNLSVKKKAKNSFTLYTTSQNTDSEFSENHNKHFHTQKLNSVSNLPSEAGSRIPINLSRTVQCSDISKKQNRLMQADKDLCMRESICTSNLNDQVMESKLEFSKQNGINILDEHEEQENVLSDLIVAKNLKTYSRSKSKVNISDSENSCVEDYPSENKQSFSARSFNLNGKSSNYLGKEYSEAELNEYMNYTGEEDEAMNESTSQNGTETFTYLGNENNLSDSKVLNSFDVENNMEELNGLLRKPRKCPTENDVCLQNDTTQERDEEDGSFGSGLSEIENAQEKFEKHAEMPESLRDCETYVQSTNSRASSRASNSSFKPLEQEEEVSDFSDSALIEKYGIKKCTVVLHRIKTLRVHYGTKFLEELAKNAYMYRENNVVDLASVYKKAKISQFSALSQEAFEHKILKCINNIHHRKKLERKRMEMVVAEEKRLEEEKQRQERKIFYDRNNFLIVNKEDIERIRQALRDRNDLFVSIERNEQADLLGREFLKSQGIDVEQDKIDREKSWNQQPNNQDYGIEYTEDTEYIKLDSGNYLNRPSYYQDYGESGQYHEVDESENDSDQSVYEDMDTNTNSSAEETLSNHNKQQDFETEVLQTHEDAPSCVNSEPCEEDLQRLQSQNHPAPSPNLESEQNFYGPLPSAKLKETITDSRWPRVLLDTLKRTVEKDCAESEVECSQSQGTGGSERTDAIISHIESTSDCNPPSLGRESPSSVEIFDDASENKSTGTANEEFVVIDEDDDDDSERRSCGSYSEEGSEPDQQLCVSDSHEKHQNSSLCQS